MPEKFTNVTITGHFGLFLTKPGSGKSHDYRDAIVSFDKLRFQNVFRPHENETPPFSNSSGLKSVFEKLRFRDGLVWTVGLTVEIKQRFQIPPAWCARCLRTGGIPVKNV